MKKIIKNVVLTLILTLSLFTFTFKVKAIESIEYIGMEDSGFIPISNEEKYIKSDIYYDEDGKAEEIIETEISKEYYDELPSELPKTRSWCSSAYVHGCWETSYKKVGIQYELNPSTGVKRLVLVNTWKIFPSVRSYDVIGLWYNNKFTRSNIYGYQLYTTSSGQNLKNTYNSSSSGVKLAGAGSDGVAGGVGISMQLPSGNLSALQQQLFVEGSDSGNLLVRGAYEHATSTISLADSKNYSFSRSGQGGVFSFNGSIGNKYDNMTGVEIQ